MIAFKGWDGTIGSVLSLSTISLSLISMDLDSTDASSDRLDPLVSGTDTDVWQALKEGQSQALPILYQRYSSLVYPLALRILGHSQDAEDLTQDIFLTLWRSRNYNPSRGSLSSYLTTLTRSRSIDKLRSRGTKFKFFQRWGQLITAESPALSPVEWASFHQRSEQVNVALAQLPPTQRQVLELAYFEGLSQSEIAQKLETPLGTVKTWSRQGLLNMQI
jgi:RNA polymerase sigma-70 factor (ECF subfamily)